MDGDLNAMDDDKDKDNYNDKNSTMSLELAKLISNIDDKSTASVGTAGTWNTQTTRTSNHHPTSTTRQRLTLLGVMILCLMALTMAKFPGFVDHYSHNLGNIVAKTEDDDVNVVGTNPLQPRKELVLQQHHYYLLPKGPNAKPVGVLIVLHACQRSGLEFFHLPEDRIVAEEALRRGLAILSLTSQDRESGCFTQNDLTWVPNVVNVWTMWHGLDQLPRFGLAVSSGASFLFFIYRELGLSGIAAYNTPQSFLPDDFKAEAMIPTVFVTMPSDKAMARQMRKNHDELSRTGIATQIFRVSPRPFTRALCEARLPEMEIDYCNEMFDTLQNDFSQLLDKDGFVAKGWITGEWFDLFDAAGLNSHVSPAGMPYLTTHSAAGKSWTYAVVEQEVRTCEAYHGMSSEHHTNVLDFLLSQI